MILCLKMMGKDQKLNIKTDFNLTNLLMLNNSALTIMILCLMIKTEKSNQNTKRDLTSQNMKKLKSLNHRIINSCLRMMEKRKQLLKKMIIGRMMFLKDSNCYLNFTYINRSVPKPKDH